MTHEAVDKVHVNTTEAWGQSRVWVRAEQLCSCGEVFRSIEYGDGAVCADVPQLEAIVRQVTDDVEKAIQGHLLTSV